MPYAKEVLAAANGNHPLVEQMKEQVSDFLKNNELIANLQKSKTI